MLNRLWIVSGLVTALCLFSFGYWTGKRGAFPATKVVETTASYSRGAERAEELHKVVVTERVTKLPSGATTAEKITETSTSVAVEKSHESETKSTKTTQKVSPQPNWRVSVLMPPKWPVTDYHDVSVGVSRRVLGSVSIEAQVSGRGAVQVGIGVDF